RRLRENLPGSTRTTRASPAPDRARDRAPPPRRGYRAPPDTCAPGARRCPARSSPRLACSGARPERIQETKSTERWTERSTPAAPQPPRARSPPPPGGRFLGALGRVPRTQRLAPDDRGRVERGGFQSAGGRLRGPRCFTRCIGRVFRSVLRCVGDRAPSPAALLRGFTGLRGAPRGLSGCLGGNLGGALGLRAVVDPVPARTRT